MSRQLKKAILFFCLLFSTAVIAQKKSVVHLKNGSKILGTIIDSTESELQLEQQDGSVWVFKSEKIARIETYRPKVSGAGMFLRAGHGVLGGTEVSPILQVTNGYIFGPHWDAGFGVGVEMLQGVGYVPAFISGRYNLLNKTYTPFVEAYAGYDVPMGDWTLNKGGLISGGNIGFTKYISSKLDISTSIGYRFAYLKRENPWWDDFDTFTEIHRFEIKLALTFR